MKTIKDIIIEEYTKHTKLHKKEIQEKIKNYHRELKKKEKENLAYNILDSGNKYKGLKRKEKIQIIKKVVISN